MNAPIIIFAFNRPEALEATVSALQKNKEAEFSTLYIYVDGPRRNHDDDLGLVMRTREIAKGIFGFQNVITYFSDENRGLGPSIIAGVSEVIEKHGQAIVIEDDLIVQPNFLTFMNQGLDRYKSDNKVWSVCGYTNKIVPPVGYSYDSYFCTRSSSWGWGTWRDRWDSVDWGFEKWDEWSKLRKEFNKWGGSDCFGMLDGCRCGRNKSWAIRFCFNQFLQDKLSLFPTKSFVNNDGFDGKGTNCKKYSRFKFELMPPTITTFSFPESVDLNKKFQLQAIKYHSIYKRLWSRLMYLIKK